VENINFSFLDFCREQGVVFKASHRQAHRNIEAGYKSVAKYDRPQPNYDRGAFALACTFLRKHFGPYVSGTKVLDQETVLQDLDRTTAAGYPWNMLYHSKGEMLDAGFIQPIEWYWNYISEVPYQLPIEVRYQQAYHPIWTNTEKKEIRETQKIIDNKIRTFTASPTEFTVAANRMCLDFNNLFYEATNTCSFVGRSKFMQGWQTLYFTLGRFREGFEFDAGNYDASVFRDALIDQKEFRWECFMSEFQTALNRRRMNHIYGEIIHSVIVLESDTGVADVILKDTGNPSGSVNTIVDNTMVLYRIFAYCWIRLCPKEYLDLGYAGFNDNVQKALNGDDNTMTVSPAALYFFNAPAIMKTAYELGISLTTPCEIPRHVLDLSFLSHVPVLETAFAGQWILPAPNYDRVLSSLTYGSESVDIRWHLLRAAALHVDSWANKRLRQVLMDYIKYILRRYKNSLIGTIYDVKIADIFGMIQSDEWCFALYTGLESKLGWLYSSGVGAVKQIPHKIFEAMSLIRSEGVADLSSLKNSFYPPLQTAEVRYESAAVKCAPIAPGGVGVPIKILVQRKRKRTGEPNIDGLTGIERNPGPDYGEGMSSYLPLVPPVVSAGAYGAARDVLTDKGSVYPEVVDLFGKLNNQFSLLDTVEDVTRWFGNKSPRARTGNPYTDGLVGIESNPGPNQKKGKKIRKLAKEIKRERKQVKKITKRVGKAPKRRSRNLQIAETTAPVNTGSIVRNNFFSTGATDGLMADCAKIGGLNVKGRCYSNLSIGSAIHATAGDYPGMFLDGAPVAGDEQWIAFNFQDFDDRIQNLAETYQYYRVRFLQPAYVPMVATSTAGQWAFSINDNFNPTSGHEPTSINSLLTSNIAGAGTLWVPSVMPAYVYNSAKVWSCPTGEGDGVTSIIAEQLTFLARVLITAPVAANTQYGKIMFEYSIDFFEPRPNAGSVTLFKPSPALLRDILTYDQRREIRNKRITAGAALCQRFKKMIAEYENNLSKDEECDSPFVMEQNPLTQSIHLPRNVVQTIMSLSSDSKRNQ